MEKKTRTWLGRGLAAAALGAAATAGLAANASAEAIFWFGGETDRATAVADQTRLEGECQEVDGELLQTDVDDLGGGRFQAVILCDPDPEPDPEDEPNVPPGDDEFPG